MAGIRHEDFNSKFVGGGFQAVVPQGMVNGCPRGMVSGRPLGVVGASSPGGYRVIFPRGCDVLRRMACTLVYEGMAGGPSSSQGGGRSPTRPRYSVRLRLHHGLLLDAASSYCRLGTPRILHI